MPYYPPASSSSGTDPVGVPPGGRLTTESGVPVSTSDRTSQSTIYYTPYLHNRIGLYSGSAWTLYTFTERSLSLAGLTSARNYDVFLYDNSGTLTLELSAAWTNDTTRADALTTQDGILVKSGATTRRYLGTIRTTGATTTEDSGGGTTTQVGGRRYIWNTYNQVPRPLAVIDTTNSWTYSTNSWRQANGATGNRVEFVAGLSGGLVTAFVSALVLNSASNSFAVGVGLDSTSANSARLVGAAGSSTFAPTAFGRYAACPVAGYHALNWLEIGGAAGTTTFYGDAGQTFVQGGLMSEVMG